MKVDHRNLLESFMPIVLVLWPGTQNLLTPFDSQVSASFQLENNEIVRLKKQKTNGGRIFEMDFFAFSDI